MTSALSIARGTAIPLTLTLLVPSLLRASEAPQSITFPQKAAEIPSETETSHASATRENAEKADGADPSNSGVEGWHRDGFALRNGRSRVEILGYLQEDFRQYSWRVKGDDTGAKQNPGRELRRVRIGVKARFGALSLEFGADPRNSQAPGRLKDVTAGYEFSRGLSLTIGHFKPPVSQEFLTSAGKADFVDRSMIGSRLVPDRDWGAGLSGEFTRVGYSIAVFAGDGDAASQSAHTSAAARLTLKPLKALSVSGSFMQGDVTPDPKIGNDEPAPKGASGKTASGFTYWDRPHVNGARQRLGGDMEYSRGPFRFRAEYLQTTEERKDQGSIGQTIPDVRGRGWSAQASYVLTGEKKGSTVTPSKSIFQGGPGALEVVARVEAMSFDDTGDASGFAGSGNRARNIAPAGASAIQAGLNYWFSNFLKLQGSALWESYSDPLIAPVPGNTGRYFTLIGRVQVSIP